VTKLKLLFIVCLEVMKKTTTGTV